MATPPDLSCLYNLAATPGSKELMQQVASNLTDYPSKTFFSLPVAVRHDIVEQALLNFKVKEIEEYITPNTLCKIYSRTQDIELQARLRYHLFSRENKTLTIKAPALTSDEIEEGLKNVESLDEIETLSLESCDVFRFLSFLHLFPNLKSLKASRCTSLIGLEGVSSCKQLEKISLEHCSRIGSLEGLKGVKTFHGFKCENLKDVSALPANIEELELDWCLSLKTLKPVSDLKSLKRLSLLRLPRLTKIEQFGPLPLERLNVTGSGVKLERIEGFKKLHPKIEVIV